MKSTYKSARFLALFALIASVMPAEPYSPGHHPYIPTICSPPGFPTSNQPPSPFDDGTYLWWYWYGGYNPDGYYYPPGWYDDNIVSIGRDFAPPDDPDPAYAPPLPPWVPIVCDPIDGAYYWAGGYMDLGNHMKYLPEGWYQPAEFY